MTKSFPTVLIVCDNSADCDAIEGRLSPPYTCDRVPTAAMARMYCETAAPGAIVLSSRLSDGDSLALIDDLLGAHGVLAFTIVLLLGADDPALAARALTVGASDCLAIGRDLPILPRAIAAALAQLALRRENAELRRELSTRAAWTGQSVVPMPTSLDQAVLDSLSAHVAVLGGDGQILMVNAAWRRFAREGGLTHEQALAHSDVGANYLAVCRASAAAGVLEAGIAYTGISCVLDGTQNSFSLEYSCHSPQAQRWFLMHVTPLAAPQGGLVVAHTDVTARVQAELALRASEAQLAGIIDAAMDAIVTLDADQRIVGWNAAAELMFGCSAADAIGQPHDRFLPPHYRADHTSFVRAFGKTGQTSRVMGQQRVLAGLRPDGTEFPIEASISSINVGGQTLYTAIVRDITRRKGAETALRESEEKYRTLFDTIDEGFCLIELDFDQQRNITDLYFREVNHVFERQTGLSNVVGKTIHELLPNFEAYWADIYARVVKTGEPERVENYTQDVDRWYSSYFSRVGNQGSQLVAVVFDDITERKRREAQLAFLAALQDELARLVSAEQIMAVVGAKLGAYLNITDCLFAEADEMHSQVRIGYRWHTDATPDLRGVFQISDFVSDELWQALRAGETVVVRNAQTDPRTNAERYAALNVYAQIIVPFHDNSKLRNLLSVGDSTPRDWRDDEVELVREVMLRVFPRLDRARAEEALRVSEARQRFLLRLNDLLLPLTDPIQIQFTAVQALGEHLHLSRAGYAEDQGDGETIRLTRNYTDHMPGIEGLYRYSDYGPQLLREFRAGRTVVRPDIANDPGLTNAEKEAHATLQLGATVNVPLVRDGRLRAILFAHQREARAWPPEEVALIEAVAARTWDAVERARAESALRASEEQYRTLFEAMYEGFAVQELIRDEAGTVVDARYVLLNPAHERHTGLKLADTLGKLQSAITPKYRDFSHHQRVVDTGVPEQFERYVPGFGRWYDLTFFRHGSNQLAILYDDITERKQAEQALSESRLQLLNLSTKLVNAQEDERRTLAYELHDEIGQQLTVLKMALESVAHVPDQQRDSKLGEVQQLIAELTVRVRQLSLNLRPPMIDELGLLATLRWYLERYMQQTNLVVDFKYSGLDTALPPYIAIAAYRIIQEGLTNVVRHAQTATATVRVWTSTGQLKISIEDQGRGFDLAATPAIGSTLGLASMRERAELLGGSFSIDSTPGEGTSIRVTLPLHATDVA